MSLVIQIGMTRSGTTIIYQLLKCVLPNKQVVKMHQYCPGHSTYPHVVNVRDFRDVMVSQQRMLIAANGETIAVDASNRLPVKQQIPNADFSTEEQVKAAIEFTLQAASILSVVQQEVPAALTLWLRYKSYFNNYDYAFDEFEKFFNITISEAQRTELKQKYSLENNRTIASKLTSFSEFDRDSFIHGGHIYNGKPGHWKQVVPKEFHALVNDSFRDLLTRWDYEI